MTLKPTPLPAAVLPVSIKVRWLTARYLLLCSVAEGVTQHAAPGTAEKLLEVLATVPGVTRPAVIKSAAKEWSAAAPKVSGE